MRPIPGLVQCYFYDNKILVQFTLTPPPSPILEIYIQIDSSSLTDYISVKILLGRAWFAPWSTSKFCRNFFPKNVLLTQMSNNFFLQKHGLLTIR